MSKVTEPGNKTGEETFPHVELPAHHAQRFRIGTLSVGTQVRGSDMVIFELSLHPYFCK